MSEPLLRVETTGICATRVRLPRRLSLAAKALVAVGAVAMVLPPHFPAWVGLWTFGLPLPLFALSYLLSLEPARSPGALEIHEKYVHLGAARIVPRSAIVGALVVERAGGFRAVEVELADGDRYEIALAHPHEEQVVDALGFGAKGKRVRMTMAKPTARLLHLAMGLAAPNLSTVIAMVLATVKGGDAPYETVLAWWPLLTLIVYELLVRLVRGPIVTVGDDVVRVERGLRARTVPLDGAFDSEIRGSAMDVDRKKAIVALARVRASSRTAADRAALVERGGKGMNEWRAQIAGAVEGASYRGTPLTADDARAILESGGATPEQRVGAAFALRVAGQTEAIRVAAERSADDRVRVALEAVAEEDDAKVEKALRRTV